MCCNETHCELVDLLFRGNATMYEAADGGERRTQEGEKRDEESIRRRERRQREL